MSGIMGIHNLDATPVSRKDLEQMVSILAHRGPDGADIWVNGSVGLGHRMLWTTSESLLEKLPFTDSTGELVITSDARIDNREELIDILQFNNCPSEKITDSQLILAAYKKWGNSCPEHLLGDFAFVIWDQRNQSLFCARDHFGIKPFYYYYKEGKTFVFGSEIKALFTFNQIPRRLNEVRIGDFLALMMEDRTITSYQDVLRLPPAHTMVINQLGVQLRCYWSLDPNREIKLPSNEAYALEFRKIFTEAVRCRLRSAFPVISHLSGGLDSSSVTCVARDILSKEKNIKLDTISTIYDKIVECDERPYINAVLEQGGLNPHFVHGDEFGPLSNLEMIFQYEDEAYLGPSHFYPWLVNRASKELGIRVALDGFDGDTTVSHGINRLREIAQQGQWKNFFHEAKAISHNYNVSPTVLFRGYGLQYLIEQATQGQWLTFCQAVQIIHQNLGTSRKELITNYGLKPAWRRIRQYFLQRKRSNSNLNAVSDQPLLNNNFAKRIGLNERIQTMKKPKKPPQNLREEHWRNLTLGVITYTLESSDQYAAMFSIETRHPFMDKRLIEFCLALPAEQKLFNGFGRVVMRRALDGILPEKVQWRGGKADLSTNFDDGFLNRNREILDNVMSHKIQHLDKYINLDFVQATYQRLVSSERKAGEKLDDDECIAVWQAVIIAIWFDYQRVTP
ncbi:asparagine synthetase B [Dulcicalothrix desertica PCC 7102]|uniref:asparagine synthase (glutamine-hydrolyzing) n=1 Tax=Dulcicalothrix desertica PCC 7102 TaxID=232991 RepID=A0A3S1CYC3_9CYAN|nr:lasso peptide isopeptide bond-forming cyclase [Dulcicalothrix desertica]RUT00259.1 asparagine synthetase B [Dulcicalothrix desertica PCC 7102]TWH55725.1 asparagine synthase (glutamine-hydrolysing) [Dulcicalothrix desertica PCC 7102]